MYGDNNHGVAPNAIYEWAGELEGDANAHSFSRDGALVLTRGDDVYVWNCSTLKKVTLPQNFDPVFFWGFVDNNTAFMAGGQDVRFWNVNTGTLNSTAKVLAQSHISSTFAMNQNGSLVVFSPSSNAAQGEVWKPGGAKPVGFLPHKLPMYICGFDPEGRRVITRELTRGDKVWYVGSIFHLWDAQTCRETFSAISSSYDSEAELQAADFDPTGKRFVVAQLHGFAMVDAATGKTLAEMKWPQELRTESLFFSPDGKLVIAPTSDRDNTNAGPLQICDSSSMKLIRSIGEHIYSSCAVSSDGKWIVCSPMDGDPELWDIVTGQRLQTFPGAGGISVAMSADKSTIAFGGRNTKIYRIRKEK